MGIYLDNAATSFPKPACVLEAMRRYFEDVGANSGRSAYRQAQEASRIVFETRECVAGLLGVSDSSRVIFTSNATEGLNIAIQGILQRGDEVITTSIEHNSVMRPLRFLEKTRSIGVHVVACMQKGVLDPDDILECISPRTRLIIMTSASNVIGTLLPVAEVATIAREHGILLLVDAAQTIGSVPLNVNAAKLDMVAFSGHKGLLGPQGTGCLFIREGLDVTPLRFGGTGSRSEFEVQPDFSPDKYESGTLNVIGIAGLGAAVKFIMERGIDAIRAEETRLTGLLLDKLSGMKSLAVYGSREAHCRTGVVSINIEGMEPSEVGLQLDERFHIAARVGLHCSPASHRTLGTFPGGTVRLSLGPFNTDNDVEMVCNALEKIAAGES